MADVIIPDRNGDGNRLAVSWGTGNVISMTPSCLQGGVPLQGPTKVHQVRWETSLYQPIFRKLINESISTFLSLQNLLKEESGGALTVSQLVKISRQYRSIIRDCQEHLDTLAESASAADVDTYTNQSEVLYKLELIWHLAEILIIDPKSDGKMMPQLLHWVSLHFRDCEEGAKSVLSQSSDSPEHHVQYWDTLLEFVLQGRIDQARKMLNLHSDFNSDMFASMDELLRKMPMASDASSYGDFFIKWKNWQREAVSRVQAGEFAVYPQLNNIAEILAGSEEAIDQVAGKCKTWYQWMVYRLLYTNPCTPVYDLGMCAQEAIDRFGGLNNMTSLDSVLLGLTELNIPEIVKELCLTLDSLWFPAHLLHILYHANAINSNKMDPNIAGLREYLLLEYGTSLMSHNSLWQAGVVYFDQCPVQGRQRLEALLERVALTSNYKANKVIQIAKERGLHSVVASTCKVMGMKALSVGDTGSAMTWGLRSGDAKFTTFLADKLLSEYTSTGRFSSTDLLDNLGSSICVSDRLTFLGKYREFSRLREEGENNEAAELLHSLLWSRLAPKYFWITLLIDAVPYLTSDQALFSSEQVYQLLQCLQELVGDTTIPEKHKIVLEEEETAIRLAIAKNLALSLIKEGDNGLS